MTDDQLMVILDEERENHRKFHEDIKGDLNAFATKVREDTAATVKDKVDAKLENVDIERLSAVVDKCHAAADTLRLLFRYGIVSVMMVCAVFLGLTWWATKSLREEKAELEDYLPGARAAKAEIEKTTEGLRVSHGQDGKRVWILPYGTKKASVSKNTRGDLCVWEE